jgi:hypothetical protein
MHPAMRCEGNIAKVAMARRLAAPLYGISRNRWEYRQIVKFGSKAGPLGVPQGVNQNAFCRNGHTESKALGQG